MKTLIIATAATLTLAGTAFAGNFDGSISAAQFAAKHFAQSHETGDGSRKVPTLSDESEVMSTKGSSLAAFAAAKLANGPEDKR